MNRILIRATNWVGDAVMSLPAIRAVAVRFPQAQIDVLAKPWVGGLYARERTIRRIIPYAAKPGLRGLGAQWKLAQELHHDLAILLPNSFESAIAPRLAGIPGIVGYARDARSWLLTKAVPVPKRGEIPRHQRFYYLELLRRAGILDALPGEEAIRLEGRDAAAAAGRSAFARAGIEPPVIGISPGAAYGGAKRWLPERFAEAAQTLAAETRASVAIFGSAAERELCEEVARRITHPVRNFAGRTSLHEFIDLAAACAVFLTNDSGSMHIASALAVPTVAIFGATDDAATGPTGGLARVVREPVECSPCLLRECPIDHRCMTRVSAARVVETALSLWTPAQKF